MYHIKPTIDYTFLDPTSGGEGGEGAGVYVLVLVSMHVYICVHTKYQRMFGPAVPCPPPGGGVAILSVLTNLLNWQVRFRPRPVLEAGVTRGQVRSFALFFKDQVKQFALVVGHVFEIEFCVKLHVFEN